LISGDKWRKVLRYGRSPSRKNAGPNEGGEGGKKQQTVVIGSSSRREGEKKSEEKIAKFGTLKGAAKLAKIGEKGVERI